MVPKSKVNFFWEFRAMGRKIKRKSHVFNLNIFLVGQACVHISSWLIACQKSEMESCWERVE